MYYNNLAAALRPTEIMKTHPLTVILQLNTNEEQDKIINRIRQCSFCIWEKNNYVHNCISIHHDNCFMSSMVYG